MWAGNRDISEVWQKLPPGRAKQASKLAARLNSTRLWMAMRGGAARELCSLTWTLPAYTCSLPLGKADLVKARLKYTVTHCNCAAISNAGEIKKKKLNLKAKPPGRSPKVTASQPAAGARPAAGPRSALLPAARLPQRPGASFGPKPSR